MWSRKYNKCTVCGTTDNKHVAKGMCKKCYVLNTEALHKKHPRHKRGVAEDFLTRDKLIELYVDKGMSFTDIGKLAGCTRVNAHYKLKRFGIEARSKTQARTLALDKGKIKTTKIDQFGNEEEVVFQKIRYNENFFKVWTPEMAYVLGLIYTDGNLHIRKEKSGYELGVLTFAQKEKELVEKFLKLMDCNATIRFKNRQELKNTIAGELYYFSIGNNDLSKDLLNLGVTPKKSLDMEFPDIPSKYLRHFIRGFFDGDGTVYLDNGKYPRVTLLSGSESFIISLRNILEKEGLSHRKIYGGYNHQKHAYYFRFTTKHDIRDFYKYIYEEVPNNIYYEKKHSRFSKYINLKA